MMNVGYMPTSVKYDDADYHFGAPDFLAKDLPVQNSGTHIGLFLAWIIANRLESFQLRKNAADAVEQVRSRQITGRDFLFRYCDEKLMSELLNGDGNAFTTWYYDEHYLRDFETVLVASATGSYEVEDTWANYDRIAAVIDSQFHEFHSQNQKHWWKPK